MLIYIKFVRTMARHRLTEPFKDLEDVYNPLQDLQKRLIGGVGGVILSSLSMKEVLTEAITLVLNWDSPNACK